MAKSTSLMPKPTFFYLSPGQASLLSEDKSTNATSERSFSALRRIKNYLRTTMGQEWLNHLMLLYVHSSRTDTLDMKSILNEFVGFSEHHSPSSINIVFN